MRVCSLASVQNCIELGQPLQFSVRDEGHLLLLAKGQVIADQRQLEDLFQRGALVEVDELAGLLPAARRPPPPRAARLPRAWEDCGQKMREVFATETPALAGAIEEATDQLLALIQTAPDVALAQVVRQSSGGGGHYGVRHSIHAATASQAAARYLGWSDVDQRRAFQAALTMNIAMVDLQARLATQVSPLTARQREAIHDHPLRGAQMLAEAGIQDEAWLQAIRLHHELPDGSGYPCGTSESSELAEMLRFADVYTARLSDRADRPAISARQAGRELHQMGQTSPLAGALIKAFGIFPPGSVVRLVSGEMGIVVRNGEKAYHPHVAILTTSAGEPRQSPRLADTSRDSHAVSALLPAHAMPMRISEDMIAGLIVGA
ncbi:HD-GYP domain-containing protein [Ideonella sp. B508-1]|uniref:HD-GYP domain-containing protein n=1 Tax=Ideonella sp. B508-1 TaxID=137716 RepID=UPI00034974F3|nr:HD domain-containing phosphohydrolase [Ideonella sp. B508-1]